MSNNITKRLLSVFLVLCMLSAWVLPASAQQSGVSFTQVSNDRVSANVLGKDPVELEEEKPQYAPEDVVRVSIFLDRDGVIAAGYNVNGLANNASAMAYREDLQNEQLAMIAKIELLLKEELDVVWQLTLATNLISANIKFGQIEEIEKLSGVKSVVVEQVYEPETVESGVAEPNMGTSFVQTGSNVSYAAGYTGAGSRIAIIDTGLDTQHLSFDASAYEYSLSLLAKNAGVSLEEYVAGLNMLNAEEIAAVLSQLNVAKRMAEATADDLYINSKIPFGFNYVDKNLTVDHLSDSKGEHGSHVAGIATANAYVPNGDGTFSSALEKVNVQGVAPNAQILVMKVFGAKGGAYESDYMAAIEDAIVLNVDSINMSLGSGNPGFSTIATAEYAAIYETLEKSGVVLTNSAGNAGGWADAAENGVPYLYLDDVSMQTGGSPGSYTNALTVASVDNANYLTAYLVVNGQNIFYNELMADSTTGQYFGNETILTLGGEHEYVFLNGIGTAEEFAALGEGALKGKIAMCYRGTTSFYEKANAAVEAGAIGLIVVNNQAGVINMNLTGYKYTAPAVSVQQADGEYFKTNPVTDEEGNVLGWTGTVTVPSEGYYTMSSFSSWGVPGSLELKPEITAPGGYILSVNGANKQYGNYKHDQYELMSGTSMAAPQVTGMVALVAQYIRENNLVEKTGVDARALAQSLLMSTSVPVMDGNNGGYYYSVLRQGSGLANVGAAVSADSYILMNPDATASYADGKVKVELGDDPAKEGVYTFSFTINNLTNSDQVYVLSADFFTQGAFAYNGALYMDTLTKALQPVVAFSVDGQQMQGEDLNPAWDFNADGCVNAADGYFLLESVLFGSEVPSAADLDGNGAVTSYDAFLFFEELGESTAIVSANGSVTVEVTVVLSESDRQWLANYENGAYVEGFVFVESQAVESTAHSIPVMGFYGNWSDASMFDKGSYEEYALSGEETRAPYLYESAFGKGNVNSLFVTYTGDSSLYYFGGNPLVTDETYMPERNAISGVNGDKISKIGFTSIRNAMETVYYISDLTNGEVLAAQSLGQVYSSYYYVNGGYWDRTYLTLTTNQSFKGVEDNTLIEMGLTLIPEYYVDAEGNVNWDALGEGVTFGMSFTVDNTAPQVLEGSVKLEEDVLVLKAQDNQYIAAVLLLDAAGQKVWAYTGSQADAEANDVCEFALDVSKVGGNGFLLQVYDYAMNCTTYELDVQIGDLTDIVDKVVLSETYLLMQKNEVATLSAAVLPENVSDNTVTWSSTNEAVATVDENGNVLAVGAGKAQIVATSVLDPNFSAACLVEVIDINVDLNAIVWDENGGIYFSEFNTATLPEYVKLSGDMLATDTFASACMGPDGTLYAASFDNTSLTGALYTINTTTWEATKLSDCTIQGLNICFMDLAYAPNLYGTGVDALLGIYGPYVITVDPATGECLEIIDEYDSELVGVAVCYGEYYEEDGQSEVAVYVAQANGTVTQEVYCHLPDYGMTLPFYYYMYGMRMSLETGIDVGDAYYFNSLYYDAENALLFWSAFEYKVDDQVTLYAIDEMNDFAVFELGKFAVDVWPVGGLYQDVTAATAESKTLEHVFDTTKVPSAEDVVKTLNWNAPSAQPNSGAIVDKDTNTVTVAVTAKDANGFNVGTTNGVMTVNYDPAVQTLRNVVVHADYSYVVYEEGSVTFAYVKVDGFDANDLVATLVFDLVADESVSVNVEYKEINQGYDLEIEEDVEASTLMQALADLEAAILAGDQDLARQIAAVQSALASCQAGNAALAGQISSVNNALRELIEKVAADLETAETELTEAMNAGDAALDEKITALNTALETAVAATNVANETLKEELVAMIQESQATLQAAVEKVAADLAAAQKELSAAISSGDTALDAKIAALNTALAEAKAALEAADEAAKAELAAQIDAASNTVEAAIEALTKELADVKAALEAKNAEQDAQMAKLNTFIIVVCVIACLGVAGCAAALVLVLKKKQ